MAEDRGQTLEMEDGGRGQDRGRGRRTEERLTGLFTELFRLGHHSSKHLANS